MNNRFGLAIALAAIFLNFLSFGIILPFLPLFAKEFGAGGLAIGILFSAFAFSQFIFNPILGRLSDRFGRRPIIIIALFGEGLYNLALIFSFSFWWLLGARIIGGIFGSSTGVIQAYLSDITSPNNRIKVMGYFGAAFGAGFIAGPAIGSYFSETLIDLPGCLLFHGYKFCPFYYVPQTNFLLPFLIASIISFAAAILAYFFLKESKVAQPLPRLEHNTFLGGFYYVFSQKAILFWIAFYFIGIFIFSSMETVFSIFSQFKFDLTARKIGYFFSYVGFLAAFVQVVGIAVLNRYLKDIVIVMLGGFLIGASFLFFPLADNLFNYLLVLTVFGFGIGFAHPAILSVISKLSHQEDYGVVLGATQGAGRLAQIFGSFWAGFSYQYFSPNIPFFSGGVIMFIAFFILLFLYLKNNKMIL